jgi:hypothetical protein
MKYKVVFIATIIGVTINIALSLITQVFNSESFLYRALLCVYDKISRILVREQEVLFAPLKRTHFWQVK